MRLPRSAPDIGLSRRALLRAVPACGLAALVPACSEVTPAPRAIKWGRDLCEHCHMVFGDRRFVAQIWDAEYNRARLYDDFGCAVLAAVDRNIPDASAIPFWVNDEDQPDQWLEARTARYREGATTPMGYGFAPGRSAHHGLTFKEAATAIRVKAGCEHRS